MSKFNRGDRGRLINQPADDRRDKRLHIGILGTVTEDGSAYPYVTWDGLKTGHDGDGNGPSGSFWAVEEADIELVVTERAKRPANQNTKIEKIKAHLLSGKSLTQLEALGLYGAFRLAARVHELKAAGMKIRTTIKHDPNGNPYAEYALVTRKVAA